MTGKHEHFPDWADVWRERAGDYNAAGAMYPDARRKERDTLLADMDLRTGQSFVDVGAAGGYLLRGVRERFGVQMRIYAIEPSASHAAALPDYVTVVPGGTMTSFALPDGSVDRVCALSGLHHTEDQTPFYTEAFRVLRPGGRLGAAEVRKGSRVDTWLNTIVDRYNPDGHVGNFIEDGQMSRLMRAAGFLDVRERRATYTWDFKTATDMAAFCKGLFSMRDIDLPRIAELIEETLGTEPLPGGGVGMKWELIQAFGRKPDERVGG